MEENFDRPGVTNFLINCGYIAVNAFKLATVERASTVFQTQNFNPRMVPLGIKYDNFSEVMQYTVRHEGFGGVFRGVRATVLMNIINGQFEKFISQPVSRYLGVDLDSDKHIEDLLIEPDLLHHDEQYTDGADETIEKKAATSHSMLILKTVLGKTIVTGTGLLLLYALEFSRIKVQTDIVTDGHRYYSNIFLCIKKTIQNSGFFALYTGMGITILGLFGYKFSELWLHHLMRDERKQSKGRISRFICKHLPGLIASWLVYPLFTVRNTMILQVGTQSDRFYFDNAADCLIRIVKKYGIQGLYGGFWLSALFGIIYRELLFTREKIIQKGEKKNTQVDFKELTVDLQD